MRRAVAGKLIHFLLVIKKGICYTAYEMGLYPEYGQPIMKITVQSELLKKAAAARQKGRLHRITNV